VAQVADPELGNEGHVLAHLRPVAGLEQLVLAVASSDQWRGALDPGADDESAVQLELRRVAVGLRGRRHGPSRWRVHRAGFGKCQRVVRQTVQPTNGRAPTFPPADVAHKRRDFGDCRAPGAHIYSFGGRPNVRWTATCAATGAVRRAARRSRSLPTTRTIVS